MKGNSCIVCDTMCLMSMYRQFCCTFYWFSTFPFCHCINERRLTQTSFGNGNTREQKNERERSKQMYSRLKPRSRQYLSTHLNDTRNDDTKERNSLFNDVSYCGFVIHLVIIVNNKCTTQYSRFRIHRTPPRTVIPRIHNSLKNYLNRF